MRLDDLLAKMKSDPARREPTSPPPSPQPRLETLHPETRRLLEHAADIGKRPQREDLSPRRGSEGGK